MKPAHEQAPSGPGEEESGESRRDPGAAGEGKSTAGRGDEHPRDAGEAGDQTTGSTSVKVGADATSTAPAPWLRLWVAMVAGGLALVLVAAGVVFGPRVVEEWVGGGTAAREVAAPSPTQPPSPFAGTPAEDFAEGEAGIVLPPAEPIEDFTAEEVAEALELVKAALIAARLDPAMLVDHDLDQFLMLLAEDQLPAMQLWFDSGDSRAFATRVATDASLAAVPPRVTGDLSYRVTPSNAPDTPIIEVTSRFVWVYAFESGGVDPGDYLVVVRDEVAWQVKSGLPWVESSEGLWRFQATANVWGADCKAFDDGLLRPAFGDLAETDDDLGLIFNPDGPLDPEKTC